MKKIVLAVLASVAAVGAVVIGVTAVKSHKEGWDRRWN